MKTRMTIAGVAGVVLATAAWAQGLPSVARLTQVNGNVLVSRQAGMTAATEAQGLTNGSRVITTANSGAVIEFENGCRVELKENQRLEVDSQKPCAALIPESLAVADPAVGPALAGYIIPALIGGGAAAGGGSGGGVNPLVPVSPN